MRLGLFALLAAGSLLAQRPTAGGFGSVLYPGTGGPPNARPSNGSGVAAGGFRHFAPPPPAVRHPQHGRTVIVPYPVYYGGGYYSGYPSNYAPQEAPQAAYPTGPSDSSYQQTQPPVVIINQYFRPDAVNPQVRDYSNVPLPPTMPQQGPPQEFPAAAPADDSPSYYLIAMKDHAIIAAVTYWVDGDTIHYITLQGDQNKASLDLVDRDFSKQLNADRRIEFKLPAK